jgi:hypothetical protein
MCFSIADLHVKYLKKLNALLLNVSNPVNRRYFQSVRLLLLRPFVALDYSHKAQ